MKQLAYTFLIVLLMIRCDDNDDPATLTLPANLQVTATVTTKGLGQVSVAASADNANFYSVYFGLGSAEVPVKTSDGKATHTYTVSGSYTIRVQAHATDADFVSKETTVVIELDSDGEVKIPTTGFTTPLTYDGMTLVWQDEFEGTQLNTADWTFETGGHGWGNEELQFYKKENTTVADGYLIITAKKETVGANNYTSSRIITKDKQAFKYGRIDIRAALPKGQGIWPALWMLGSSFPTTAWPASGEIDIMEMVGGTNQDNTVHGTVHWDQNGNYASYTKSKALASGIFNDEFHVFSIVWTSSSIIWYLDNVQFNVIDTTPAALSEFQESFFLIFNVAVGGKWPGSPNNTTVFPQHMIVDYVRVFQPE